MIGDKRTKIQFTDNENRYFVSIQKRLSGKWRVYVTKQKESDHGNFSTPITYKITASTVKETLEYWLIRLKNYFLKKKHK